MEATDVTIKDMLCVVLQARSKLPRNKMVTLAKVLSGAASSSEVWPLKDQAKEMPYDFCLLMIGRGKRAAIRKATRNLVVETLDKTRSALPDDIQQYKGFDQALFHPHRWLLVWELFMGGTIARGASSVRKLLMEAHRRGLGFPPSTLVLPEKVVNLANDIIVKIDFPWFMWGKQEEQEMWGWLKTNCIRDISLLQYTTALRRRLPQSKRWFKKEASNYICQSIHEAGGVPLFESEVGELWNERCGKIQVDVDHG